MITYSTYDAKANFSEIIRQVREGKTVTVTYHGEPVAVVRPIATGPESLTERLERLEADGLLARSTEGNTEFRSVERRSGALDRFLAERD